MATNLPQKEPVKQEFDTFASKYDEALNKGLSLTGEKKEYYAQNRVNWLEYRLRRLGLKIPKNCLDYGCGTGTSAPYLLDTFELTEYLGFDPSTESTIQAELNHGTEKVSLINEITAVKSESIDLAFCNGVFHHIPIIERLSTFEEVSRVLSKGGVFAFWENNPWNPMVHYIMRKVDFDKDAIMLWPKEATKLGLAAGFQRLDLSFKFIFPAALEFARSLEPILSPLPLGGQYLLLFQKNA